MVQRVPGFTLSNGEDARGLSGTAGNVLINGDRPSSKSDTVTEVLRRIPAEQVVRIELIRGGAPGIDMQGRAVVVNVIAVQSKPFSGSATIGGDQVLTMDRRSGSLDLVGAYKASAHQTFRGELTYDTADGPGLGGGGGGGPGGGGGGGGGVSNQISSNRNRLTPAGTSSLLSNTTSDGSSNGWSGLAGYDFRVFGGDGSMTLQSAKSKSDLADTEIFSIPAGSPRLGSNHTDRTNGEFDFNYSRPVFGDSNLALTGLKSWRETVSNATSVVGSSISGNARDESSGETVGRAALTWRPFASLSTLTSAEAAYNTLDSASSLVVGGVFTPLPGSNAQVSERRGEVSSIATWQAQPQLVIEGGVRYEFSTLTAGALDKKLHYLKPSLQATIRIDRANQVRIRLERTVGQLDFTDFTATASLGTGVVTAGAAELVPTQDWALSMVYDRTFWTRGSFRLALKADKLDDVIDRTTRTDLLGNVFDTTGNIGQGRKANFNANLNLPLDKLGISGGRLVLDGQFRFLSRVKDPVTGETRRVSRDSPYTLMGQYSQDITSWRVTYGLSYSQMARSVSYRRTGRDITQNDPQISAYINYNPSSRTSWRLDMRNINAGHMTSVREVYPGRRDATIITYAENRTSTTARAIRLTLRRSL